MARTKALAIRVQDKQKQEVSAKKKRRVGARGATRRIATNIRKVQRSTQEFFFGHSPIDRIIREISNEVSAPDIHRFAPNAVAYLRAAADEFVYDAFKDAYRITLDNKRLTLTVQDFRLAVQLKHPKLL